MLISLTNLKAVAVVGVAFSFIYCYAVRYLVPINTSNWARYVDKIKSQVRTGVDQYRSLKILPNRLTFVYSENHNKEENYLKVKTVIFKYITPPHSNGLVL